MFCLWLFGGILLQDDDDYSSSTSLLGQKKPGYHAPVALLNDIPQSTEQVTFFSFLLKPEFTQLKKTVSIPMEALIF